MDICPPCGGCRQRLAEFAAPTRPCYLGRPGGPTRDHDDRRAAAARLRARGVSWRDARPRRSLTDRAPACAPRVGIVLGSGLGAVADAVAGRHRDRLRRAARLPGARASTGHGGQRGARPARRRAGARAAGPRAPLRGRRPRTRSAPRCARCAPPAPRSSCSPTPPARCAPEVGPGSLMAISDHINLIGVNPLTGPNDDDDRPALPEPARRLRPGAARRAARERAASSASTLAEGVYLAVQRAELRDAGRDPRLPHAGRRRRRHVDRATRRSVARHCGLRVAAVSAITNLAEGMGDVPLSHEQTLRDAAARRRATSRRCSTRFVERLGLTLRARS